MQAGVWWAWLLRKRPVGRPKRRWEGNIKMYIHNLNVVHVHALINNQTTNVTKARMLKICFFTHDLS
jgi:hypothetical protein